MANEQNEWTTIQTVHAFDRATRRTPEQVITAIREVNGNRFVDIRIHRWNQRAGEYRPTRRGITLPVAHADDLQLATVLLVEATEARA